ncbi:PAS domain S-box protein [Alicyclobacillus dauci]|uniref:histidine kinase n=1 Tax=Alicyclobacillus dauci TaxID=1475485 RepID=A0ABY6Z6R2_9BACL|nr:PAS domain S-box protein [Alicyclobacillus dauci]WAH38469.1 PAS domain S-box protein [Alicyclobacillus dauci]
MVSFVLSVLGLLLCIITLIMGIRLYTLNRRLSKDIQLMNHDWSEALRKQQGMTFKFAKQNGRFIHTLCEGKLVRKFGLMTNDIVGKTLADFLHDSEDVAGKESFYERAWQGEEVVYEGQLNGVWYIASLCPIFRHGRVCEVVASCVDITQQKLAEQDLRKSEQMYRLIAESSADLIRILAPDATIRYASPSHLEVLGYDPTELEGIPSSELVVPEERPRVIQSFFRMLNGKSHHYPLHFHVRHKDGSPIMVETHGSLVFDERGEVVAVVVVARDLTSRMKEEEENRRREKLTLAGQLAAGIAHEIRNPLAAIKGFTQLLRTPSDRQTSYTELVLSELARVEAIVNEFLLLANRRLSNTRDTTSSPY